MVTVGKRGNWPLLALSGIAGAFAIAAVSIALTSTGEERDRSELRIAATRMFVEALAHTNPWQPTPLGPLVLRDQVSTGDYAFFLSMLDDLEATSERRQAEAPTTGDPSAPIAGLTARQAMAFCGWLGARLPLPDEWSQRANPDAWPALREWTQPPAGTHVMACGGYTGMTAETERSLRETRWCSVADFDDAPQDLRAHVGFRCMLDRR